MGVIYGIIKTMCPLGYHHITTVAYIMLLAVVVEHSLVHWYQQCVTVHHVPKCMSYHKAIMVITGMVYCFHDSIYIP